MKPDTTIYCVACTAVDMAEDDDKVPKAKADWVWIRGTAGLEGCSEMVFGRGEAVIKRCRDWLGI